MTTKIRVAHVGSRRNRSSAATEFLVLDNTQVGKNTIKILTIASYKTKEHGGNGIVAGRVSCVTLKAVRSRVFR